MSDSVFRYLFGMPRTEVVRRLRDLANDLDQITKRDDIGASSVVIYDWALAKRAVPCLIGRAKGHPNIEDGHALFSSELSTSTKNEASRGRSRVGISLVTGLTQTPGTKDMGAANEGLDILGPSPGVRRRHTSAPGFPALMSAFSLGILLTGGPVASVA